jgi:hypothetical protein
MRVTANNRAFTLTDGALRMRVVFHFHALGDSTLDIALLIFFLSFSVCSPTSPAAGSEGASGCG